MQWTLTFAHDDEEPINTSCLKPRQNLLSWVSCTFASPTKATSRLTKLLRNVFPASREVVSK